MKSTSLCAFKGTSTLAKRMTTMAFLRGYGGRVCLTTPLIVFSLCAPGFARPMGTMAKEYIAIDGDTITDGVKDIRILGLDTPETYQPQCPEEARLGYAAAGRLQHLLNS